MLRIASSPSSEAHLSKRARLMLRCELGRLAEPISEWWNGRQPDVAIVPATAVLLCQGSHKNPRRPVALMLRTRRSANASLPLPDEAAACDPGG